MEPEENDHAYFLAVEEIFVGLRGTPFLLAPADWQVARRWRQEGIPLDLVRQALEEVFARRRERRTRGRISSLRYCAAAVESAWADRRELTVPGRREPLPRLEVAPRLAALAAALPAGLPRRELFAARIAAAEGEPSAVEERLGELDREILEAALAALPAADRAELDGAVERTLAGLARRLPATEIAPARERLARQQLRRQLRLPVVSLFSPETEGSVPAPEDPEDPADPKAPEDLEDR
jgi:hypothetical protein